MIEDTRLFYRKKHPQATVLGSIPKTVIEAESAETPKYETQSVFVTFLPATFAF